MSVIENTKKANLKKYIGKRYKISKADREFWKKIPSGKLTSLKQMINIGSTYFNYSSIETKKIVHKLCTKNYLRFEYKKNKHSKHYGAKMLDRKW